MAAKTTFLAGKVLDKVLKNDHRLEKIDGYYRLIGCHSTYAEHSKLLTQYLADILKLNLITKIFREKTLNEIGLRPDALILLIKANQKLCFILEVCNNEMPEYLLQKIHTWQNWPEAKDKLSELFSTQIKSYDFVVSGDDIPDGAFEYQAYMEELKK